MGIIPELLLPNSDGSTITPGGHTMLNHDRRGDGGRYFFGKVHTPDSIDRILDIPADRYPTRHGDTASSGQQGATVVMGEDGDWVIVNDETGQITQVNDRNNPRQQPPARPEETENE